ncbi:MAG: 4-hydroxy-tetrahydrodipicolinate synthase, partial [Acetivibrio ethanolgignens]
MAIFKGEGVALVTPMNEDGSVNFEKLEELVELHIANGTDAIIACGTTGESATLPIEEHLEVIRVCIEVAKKRIPIIAGAGSNSTSSAIYTSTQSEKLGADGLLLVTPYYNKATQNGLIAHFTTIANSVKIPAILYNVGSRTGVNMAAATTAKLVKTVDNIVGIKEASGNISQVAEIMSLTDGNIDLYSGNDDQIVPILSLGGIGVISVLSNVAPRDTHDIVAK